MHLWKKDTRLLLATLFGDAWLMDIFSRFHNNGSTVLKLGETTSPRVIVVGCPDYGNLGDQAIAFAERYFIERSTGVAPTMLYGPLEQYWDFLKKEVKADDVICLQGGGNMGTLYESYENERLAMIERFKRNRIVLFPQTISYGSTAHERRYIKHLRRIYESHPDLHLVARERMSLERMNALFPNANIRLTPDIVLSLSPFVDTEPVEREGLCLCLRADKERRLRKDIAEVLVDAADGRFGASFRTDTMHPSNYLSPEEGELAVRAKIAELSRAKLVVTDRIHGMIFCALSGTPCIALDNSNGKVGMEYEWLRGLSYMRFARDADEAAKLLNSDDIKPGAFPSNDFFPLFDSLSETISGGFHGKI